MIGVIADSSEREVVSEFFELFKTPWEWYGQGRRYAVVLCAGGSQFNGTADLVLRYAGRKISFDSRRSVVAKSSEKEGSVLSYNGRRIPIYGAMVTFAGEADRSLVEESSGESATYVVQTGSGETVRVGYDLFGEIRHLLTQGQPPCNADTPTLELHIAFLRDLITHRGIPLIEIPPVPDGYSFTACLTHDVDHPFIRRHKLDHTIFGFVYRAAIGSVSYLLSRRITVRDLLRNWTAVLKLPLVYLGLASDFWSSFAERYLELEKGLRSTFFVIPFGNCPGRDSRGEAPKFRAAQYGAADLADTIQKLIAAGCEVGLHGIDAWRDAERGQLELDEIRRLTGNRQIGVRMHWLYYDHHAPSTLEKAEATYDSTMGYNETVGYRVGTTQVYKPLAAARVRELPLHIMDTAMFYPAYLGLSPRRAKAMIAHMADNAVEFGGCLTVNWHDRSLASERLWSASYRELIQELKRRGAWFATGSEAVSWFQKRRSVVFEKDSAAPLGVGAVFSTGEADRLPALRLRLYERRGVGGDGGSGVACFKDMSVEEVVGRMNVCGANR